MMKMSLAFASRLELAVENMTLKITNPGGFMNSPTLLLEIKNSDLKITNPGGIC